MEATECPVMTFSEPLRFSPMQVAKPWGGGELLRRFGVSVPESPPTGEVWLVSDVPGKPSKVREGRFAGKSLSELVRDHGPELLGKAAPGPGGRFPLLVKLLEVEGKLSVQVHPDARLANENGDGAAGKFEAWFVLSARDRARVSLGFDRDVAASEVRELVASSKLQERLNTFAPVPGDGYVISPGVVHAATGGLLFLEVQETADVTYRLYDWGTMGLDGKPRELHVEKALTCTRFSADARTSPGDRATHPRALSPGVEERPVVGETNAPFSFSVVDVGASSSCGIAGEDVPWIVVALSGKPRLEGRGFALELAVGEAVLWPASLGPGKVVAREASRIARARPR